MIKSKEAVWYDWAGPSGYEENMHISEYNAVPVPAATQAATDTKRRRVMAGRCFCSSRIAVSV